MWDLPRPGIESVLPALAGGFLTIVPPGKSLLVIFYWRCVLPFICENSSTENGDLDFNSVLSKLRFGLLQQGLTMGENKRFKY